MRVVLGFLVLVSLSGCTMYWARQYEPEQVETAIKIIEAQKGSGCICTTLYGSVPGAFEGGTEIVGEVGAASLKTCQEVCLGLRR